MQFATGVMLLILLSGTALLAQINFEAEIQPIFNENCALSGCHSGNDAPFGLDLTAGNSFDLLVGVASGWNQDFFRVDAENPDDSYLVMKLEDDPRIQGQQMPAGGADPLPQEQIDLIRLWITEGAVLVGIEGEENLMFPSHVELQQNYPNPFNPTTTINYELSGVSDVSIVIYDILGHRVKQLIASGRQQAGKYSTVWDGTNETGSAVAGGVYFYQLTAINQQRPTDNQLTHTRKMILMR